MPAANVAFVNVIAEAVRLLESGHADEAHELLAAVIDVVSPSERSRGAADPTQCG